VSESAGVITVAASLDCIVEEGRHTSCIQTGIALRDGQIWKYLESGRFQKAVLSVERNRLRIPAGEEVAADAVGMLALHGVSRQLSFHYVATRTGNDIQVNGKIMINLNDFNIERPSFFGVHTGMVAQIKVRFTLQDS
jgi:polyisoprenoid-binding protein YceI